MSGRSGDDVAPASVVGGRGTRVQRLRAGSLRAAAAIATRCPTGLVGACADAAGELWYRLTPGRAAMARANLGRVCADLARTGRGTARARRAASDPRELERIVRAAYRHSARTYAELLRRPAIARELWSRLTIEQPETVEPAFSGGAAIFATMHFGSIQAISEILARLARTPVTAPMETLDDPELQRFVAGGRAASGLRLVSLVEARRELRAALRRGELAGMVADRDIAGGGIPVPLFGSPAPIPAGPAMLALEAGVAIHVAAARRVAHERYTGSLETIRPEEIVAGVEGRRARVEAVLAEEARAFERFIAAAPEQWWAVFFPIWPDLGPAPRSRPGTRPSDARTALDVGTPNDRGTSA